MTEIVEAVSIAVINHEGHSEDTCAFCSLSTEPTTETNDLTDDYDEDKGEIPGVEDDGVLFKNSAGKLGKDLKNNGSLQDLDEVVATFRQVDGNVVRKISRRLPVGTSAHHLIPGNASLKNSEIMDFLYVDGKAKGNIGYNVNNYENGVWLPGNYALRGKNGLPKWGGEASKYIAEGGDPKQYAFAAIEKTRAQFHDAHEKYSDFVLDILDLLAEKLEMTGSIWCEEAGNKPDNPEDRQMFMLVARLNTISRRMKRMLVNPSKNWKRNVYTSRFCKEYIDEVIYK